MNFLPVFLRVSLFLGVASFADAKAFLDAAGGTQSETDLSDMMAMLLSNEQSHPADLSEAVRNQHAKDSHAKNQAALQAMFKSLPKNEKGNLGLPAARYALHRLFEHRHRWFVRGLHPKTKVDASGNVHVVGKAMQLLTSFDQKGLSLPALAALAGTLEELIARETAIHFDSLYEAQGGSVENAIPGDRMKQLVDAYMTIYISGADFRNNTKQDIVADDKFMTENTRDWTETMDWVKSTTLEAAKAEEGCKKDVADCSFNFDAVVRIVRTVVEKYGYFNDRQCHKVKTKLLSIKNEEQRTGRVNLADFYEAGLSGAWEFNEKIDYLRSLGALDESRKDSPKVIVPNYVSSWVNCLSSSKFYSVCCRNECEDYMKVMEKHIGGPTADPDKIIRVVETQSAFTIDTPPNLAMLRHRLVSIAEKHRGKVPIHGRLFAQWMHHAFPSTCPYPHEAGKTNPQTPDEWMAETGHTDIKASADEVHGVVSQAKDPPESATVKSKAPEEDQPTETGELPWSDVEELLVVRPTLAPQQAGNGLLDNLITFMEVVMAGAVVGLVIYVASQQRQRSRNKGHKF